jgi:hypothetical protein
MTAVWDIAPCSLVEVLMTLMVEAVGTSETSVSCCETTRRSSPYSLQWEPEISLAFTLFVLRCYLWPLQDRRHLVGGIPHSCAVICFDLCCHSDGANVGLDPSQISRGTACRVSNLAVYTVGLRTWPHNCYQHETETENETWFLFLLKLAHWPCSFTDTYF